MHGVLNVLKPPGLTSHDVVAFVRRATGVKRVGHTGTLDPAAGGVLPICIGQATRLVEDLQAGSKEYIAEATFGWETDTLDAVGKIVSHGDALGVTLDAVRAALDAFRGDIEQTPPLYSAIKRDGKKLYEIARAGEEIEIPTRRVQIDKLFVTRFVPGTQPRAMLHIKCGGGTYIRSLVRDIGRSLGCSATMTFLVRARSGGFRLHEAVTLEEVSNDARGTMLPISEVLEQCARFVVTDDDAVQRFFFGQQVEIKINGAFDLQEYKRGPAIYKLRLTRTLWNHADPRRILFWNAARTLAAFALPADEMATTYRAEKVFDLRAS